MIYLNEEKLVNVFDKYFPNRAALDSFIHVVQKACSEEEITTLDEQSLDYAIKEMSTFTTLGIYQVVLGNMLNDVKRQVDVIKKRNQVIVPTTQERQNTMSYTLESNSEVEFELDFDLPDDVNKVVKRKESHHTITPKSTISYKLEKDNLELDDESFKVEEVKKSPISKEEFGTDGESFKTVPKVNFSLDY
nr:MAG TPA: hypothetical protein [Bacteriophage sp.]